MKQKTYVVKIEPKLYQKILIKKAIEGGTINDIILKAIRLYLGD